MVIAENSSDINGWFLYMTDGSMGSKFSKRPDIWKDTRETLYKIQRPSILLRHALSIDRGFPSGYTRFQTLWTYIQYSSDFETVY